jgi:hypothetical protein
MNDKSEGIPECRGKNRILMDFDLELQMVCIFLKNIEFLQIID